MRVQREVSMRFIQKEKKRKNDTARPVDANRVRININIIDLLEEHLIHENKQNRLN